jgi:hypothetical protein
MNKNQTIRKIGKKEWYRTIKGDYDRLISISKIESRIDFTKSIYVLEKAITEWKRLHPFLDSYLQKKGDDVYFVHADNASDNFENVKVLSYGDKEAEKYLTGLLVESELQKSFDLKNKLFWRIIFLKTSENNELFNYTIIFTAHHFICEAKYKYLSLLELLDLVEDIYSENFVRQHPYSVMSAQEDCFKLRHDIEPEFFFPKIPSFIDLNEARSKSIKNDYYKRNIEKYQRKDNWLKSHNYQENVSIENLLEISSINSTKFRFIKYNKEKFEPIMQKCKQLDIKLNGCLNMILVIAHKLLYDKFEHIQLTKSTISIPFRSDNFSVHSRKEEHKNLVIW